MSSNNEQARVEAITRMMDAASQSEDILWAVRGARHLSDKHFFALFENVQAIGRGVRALATQVESVMAGVLDDMGDELR